MGAVSNVLPAQRGLYVIIGAKLSRFQSRLRVYNIYDETKAGMLGSSPLFTCQCSLATYGIH